MSQRDVFIGIDGGGTHARAVAVAADGCELGRLTGPPGLVSAAQPAATADVLYRLVSELLVSVDAVAPARVLCCALAGAGRESQREAVHSAVQRTGIASQVVVVGDAEAAMHDAFGSAAGVVVIGGTGSIAWARGPDGKVSRVGGWGQILGDEGSGYEIGLRALRAAVRAADGRDVATPLLGRLLEHAGAGEASDLVAWAAGATKADIGALTPAVLASAATGDVAASRIREQALHALAELALTAATRAGLGGGDLEIALHGGLIAPGGPLRDDLVSRVLAAAPDARILDRAIDAAAGAAAMARALPSAHRGA